MDIEKYIDKTDLILYNKIIQLIYRDWEKLDGNQLTDLLNLIRDLHQNLDGIILQKKQHGLLNKEYYKSNFDRGSSKSVKTEGISLTKMIPRSYINKEQLDKRG